MFVLAAAVLLAIALGLVAIIGDDDPPDVPDASDAGPAPADSSGEGVSDPLDPECENLHASHGIAMWNAGMADEMTAAGCPFPYEPFAPPLEGGAEDPSISTAFEPRLYSEIWAGLAPLDLGLCQVVTLPEESVDGYAFGFRYSFGPVGCPEVEGDTHMHVREYVTRAWRDAHADASTTSPTLVLGRWVIQVEGTPERVPELVGMLTSIGAVPLGND